MEAQIAPEPPTSRQGILDSSLADSRFSLTRHAPNMQLAPYVDWYWIIRWNLPDGDFHRQDVLAHPCVNAVLGPDKSGVFGPVRTRSARELTGSGQVIGAKFKPAGFVALTQNASRGLVGRCLTWDEAFAVDERALESLVLKLTDESEMVRRIETVLEQCQPDLDADSEIVNAAVALVAAHPEITRVADLSGSLGIEMRQLERLFRRYVGLTPKWVIRQHRLFEAATRLEQGTSTSWATLALELGYFDQAHFSKDFCAVVGESPVAYAKRCSKRELRPTSLAR
jgi:AraC-like DNA-binding protein